MKARHLCKEEKRELKTLADDFRLMDTSDTKSEILEIIKNCKSYSEGYNKIMNIYERVYM